MDSRTKRKLAERVRRLAADELRPLGFLRTKPTFYVRPQPQLIQFVHFHLFSYTPMFRVHFGIRVLNEPFPAAALNGPDSEQQPFELRFDESAASIDRCASEAARFCVEVGEPWFKRWSNSSRLASDPNSPLSPEARAALRASVGGGSRVSVAAPGRLTQIVRPLSSNSVQPGSVVHQHARESGRRGVRRADPRLWRMRAAIVANRWYLANNAARLRAWRAAAHHAAMSVVPFQRGRLCGMPLAPADGEASAGVLRRERPNLAFERTRGYGLSSSERRWPRAAQLAR